jgi:hypothetical protein
VYVQKAWDIMRKGIFDSAKNPIPSVEQLHELIQIRDEKYPNVILDDASECVYTELVSRDNLTAMRLLDENAQDLSLIVPAEQKLLCAVLQKVADMQPWEDPAGVLALRAATKNTPASEGLLNVVDDEIKRLTFECNSPVGLLHTVLARRGYTKTWLTGFLINNSRSAAITMYLSAVYDLKIYFSHRFDISPGLIKFFLLHNDRSELISDYIHKNIIILLMSSKYCTEIFTIIPITRFTIQQVYDILCVVKSPDQFNNLMREPYINPPSFIDDVENTSLIAAECIAQELSPDVAAIADIRAGAYLTSHREITSQLLKCKQKERNVLLRHWITSRECEGWVPEIAIAQVLAEQSAAVVEQSEIDREQEKIQTLWRLNHSATTYDPTDDASLIDNTSLTDNTSPDCTNDFSDETSDNVSTCDITDDDM